MSSSYTIWSIVFIFNSVWSLLLAKDRALQCQLIHFPSALTPSNVEKRHFINKKIRGSWNRTGDLRLQADIDPTDDVSHVAHFPILCSLQKMSNFHLPWVLPDFENVNRILRGFENRWNGAKIKKVFKSESKLIFFALRDNDLWEKEKPRSHQDP